MKKMNNKGFSLVELIVVVLIMAIIAVALAPQVIKWVNNSRLSADRQTYDDLISQIQIAMTDKNVQTNESTYTFTIADDGTTAATTADVTDSTSDTLIVAMDAVNSSWREGKRKYDTDNYTVTVNMATKALTRGEQPDGIENEDLD